MRNLLPRAPRSSLSLSLAPTQSDTLFRRSLPADLIIPSFRQPLPVLASKSRVIQRFWRSYADFTIKRVAQRFLATGFVMSKIKDTPVDEWNRRYKTGDVPRYLDEPLKKVLFVSLTRHGIPVATTLDLSIFYNAYIAMAFPNEVLKQPQRPICAAVKSAATDFVFAFESILQFASNSTDGVMGIPKQLTREFPQQLRKMVESGMAWKRFVQTWRIKKSRQAIIALHAHLEAFQGYRDPTTKYQVVEILKTARAKFEVNAPEELRRLDNELQLAPPPSHSQVFFALNGQALVWHHHPTINQEDFMMQLIIDRDFAYKPSDWINVPLQNRSIEERTPLFWKLAGEELDNDEYHKIFTVAQEARGYLLDTAGGRNILTGTQMLALPTPIPRQQMLDLARSYRPCFQEAIPQEQRDEDEELWMEAVDNFYATANYADAVVHLFKSVYRSHVTLFNSGINARLRGLAQIDGADDAAFVRTKFAMRFATIPRTEAWLRAAPRADTPRQTVAQAFLALIDTPMEELPETFSGLECQHINTLIFEKHFLVKGIALLDACQAFPEARISLLEFVETQPCTVTFPYETIPFTAIQAANNQAAQDTINRSLLRAILGQEEQEIIPSNRYLAHLAHTVRVFNAYYTVFGDLYTGIITG